jgi:hypothetical protein
MEVGSRGWGWLLSLLLVRFQTSAVRIGLTVWGAVPTRSACVWWWDGKGSPSWFCVCGVREWLVWEVASGECFCDFVRVRWFGECCLNRGLLWLCIYRCGPAYVGNKGNGWDRSGRGKFKFAARFKSATRSRSVVGFLAVHQSAICLVHSFVEACGIHSLKVPL